MFYSMTSTIVGCKPFGGDHVNKAINIVHDKLLLHDCTDALSNNFEGREKVRLLYSGRLSHVSALFSVTPLLLFGTSVEERYS